MLRNYKGGLKALRDDLEVYVLEQCKVNNIKTSKGSTVVNVIDHPDMTMTVELATIEGLAEKLIIDLGDNPGPEEEIEIAKAVKGYYYERLKSIREEIQKETFIGVQALINKPENQISLADLVGKVFIRLGARSGHSLVTGYEDDGSIHAINFDSDSENDYNVYSSILRIDDLGEYVGDMEVPNNLLVRTRKVIFYSDLVKFK